MNAKWIWINEEKTENQRGCFGCFFYMRNDQNMEEVVLEISASTRYIAYLNGKEIGRGPIRSGRHQQFFDRYSIDDKICQGENFLAVRVWDYGWSTYQTVAKPAGLIFEIKQGNKTVCSSDNAVYASLDQGHMEYAPKRNVNLGFTDYYDAQKFDACWFEKPEVVKSWPFAIETEDVWGELAQKKIRPYQSECVYPKQIVSVQQVKKGCQQITVNTRNAFFGKRLDADETTFSGFIGCEFSCAEDMEGEIAFPNRLWNGIIGDFKIDNTYYEVSRENRSISVKLTKGTHLFLLQMSGKVDDLYCHMEWKFPKNVVFEKYQEGTSFFTVGPTKYIQSAIDGFAEIYGGLNEFEKMDQETEEHEKIWMSGSLAELKQCSKEMNVPMNWVEPKYVFEDMYFLSLVRTEEVVLEETIGKELLGILWNNDVDAVITPPDKGDYRRIIVDFGDVYVGSFEFLLKAKAGTIVDVYCFENMYGGEIDYTIGLNNGFRYICKEGWQKYSCMTRMGARYAMITVRNTVDDVKIRDFHLHYMIYSSSGSGEFMCDDYLLNRIWEMCCQTHKVCSEDCFTDSPTYEQAYWIGDAQVSAYINGILHGDYEFIRHNLELAVTAGENTKLMNALTPTDWTTSIPMWMMNWIIAVQQYIEICGDETIIDSLYDPIKDTLTYYEKFIQTDGGFLICAWNMLDWAALDIHNYGVVTGHQAILAWCYKIASDFAKKRERFEDAEHFNHVREQLLNYMDQKMWNEEKQAYMDGWTPEYGLSKTVSIQTHIFLYLYEGIIDDKKKTIVEKYLLDTPEDFIKVGSPFMLNYLHMCLNKLGKSEEVLNDIHQRWGEMLHYDTTTCWEVFPGFYENSRTRSYCHSWSASPAVFCLEQILGIQRIDNGWKKIKIQVPDYAGKWCKGAVPTPYGIIRGWWEKKEKTYKLMVPRQIEIDMSAMEGWNVQVIPLD